METMFDVFDTIPLILLQPLPLAHPPQLRCDQPPVVCRFHNKGVYLKAGLQKLSHTRNLHKDLKLQVDKQEVELPSIEGLIFLNIPR